MAVMFLDISIILQICFFVVYFKKYISIFLKIPKKTPPTQIDSDFSL